MAIVGDRAIELARLSVRFAAIQEQPGDVRMRRNRPREDFDGNSRIARARCDGGEEVECVGIVGIRRERATGFRFGAREITFLEVLKRGCKWGKRHAPGLWPGGRGRTKGAADFS